MTTKNTFTDGKHFVNVLLPMILNRPLTYHTTQQIEAGQYVRVPFRNRSVTGIVWEIDVPENGIKNIKPILKIHDLPPLSPPFLQFLSWCSNYTISSLGKVLRLAMPVQDAFLEINSRQTFAPPILSHHMVNFLQEQQEAILRLLDIIQQHSDSVILLDGKTGSGKTEVYLEIVASVLARGSQALVMLPEIALSMQMLGRFRNRFGVEPAVWHSGLTPAHRRDTWRAIVTGEAKLILGARSSLFLPYHKLGLIVVDEEHESSYKQDDTVLYNARDMAIVRGSLQKIPILLVSATPSLETWQNVNTGKYHGIRLHSRYQAVMPDITLLDMRHEKIDGWLHNDVVKNAVATLSAGQQALFFINRRGYAPLTLCRACGYRWRCVDCASYLSLHKISASLQCHHCGYNQLMPNICPSCAADSNHIITCGPGVERIAEELQNYFPSEEILIFSSDLLNTPKKMETAVNRIINQDVSLIVGTQLIGKGYHFPNLTMVTVIDGDMGLSGGDFRAGEKTWQILHQIAGRAGRAENSGHVFIQTFSPDQMLMKTLKQHDREIFYQTIIKEREIGQWPPFTRLAALIISCKSITGVNEAARILLKNAPIIEGFQIFGPAPAPLSPLRGMHRVRFIVKCPLKKRLSEYMNTWVNSVKISSDVNIQVDIDPYSFV